MNIKKLVGFTLLLFCSNLTFANTFHTFVKESSIEKNGAKFINSSNYETVKFNLEAFKNYLQNTPKEFTGESLTITLPMYNGKEMHFELTETKTMEDGLAAKYPNIKTYNGQGIEDGTANLKLSITHKGIHAYIRDLSGTWAIDPYHNNTTNEYIVHHKKGFITDKFERYNCAVDEQTSIEKQEALVNTFNNNQAKTMQMPECVLRTYRIAINATGEFVDFHGGTVADGLAAVVTSLNRINGVYERDASLRMILVDDNDQLIYTDANTDPFTNNSSGDLIDESHSNIVSVLGSASFDIGHIFATGGSGLANLNAACSNNNKGRGTTGVFPPTGDFFDIDYVSHELGHQWGGNHTWDYCSGGGNGGNATMEPGSASTIMGYADLCGTNNIQNFSDDYFHSYSLLEMTDFSQLGNGNSCAVLVPNDNNAPVANAGNDYIIPTGTPFELTGDATDPDGDILTYCWEQFDTGDGTPVNSPISNKAIFRSWLPTIDNFRIMPRLQELLNNTAPFGETLPAYNGAMNFRLTVRDNFAGGGCTDFDDMVVDVDGNAGPFLLNYPNGGEAINAFDVIPVTWDVANTDIAPINCANVDILLSIDGGLTYPIVLASNISNSGSYSISIPDEQTTDARIKVVCSDNIFFDISNDEFSIIEPLAPGFVVTSNNSLSQNLCAGTDLNFDLNLIQILGFNGTVNFSETNLPAGVTVNYNSNPVTIPSTVAVTISNTTAFNNGINNFQIIGTSGTASDTIDIEITLNTAVAISTNLVQPINGATNVLQLTALEWMANANANLGYEVEIALDNTFANIIESNSTLDLNYLPTIATNNLTTFYWRVRGLNICGNGDWSTIYSYTMSNCNDIPTTDLPSITVGSQTSEINITNPGTVTNIEVVNLEIDHNRIGQLDIVLTSPLGTSIQLFNNVCGNDNDIQLNFTDNGLANNSIPCPPVGGGSFQSATGSFADFIGENALGNWVLTIEDNQNPTNGDLIGWDLKLCTELIGPNVIASSSETEICAGDEITLSGFGADNYLWFPSNNLSSAIDATVTANPTETTTYTLVGTDATGTNESEITVFVNELPELTFENLPDSIFSADIIGLSASPSGGEFSGFGVIGNFLDPFYSEQGLVEIIYNYTDVNGCSNSITATVFNSIVTGLTDNFDNLDFAIKSQNNNLLIEAFKSEALNLNFYDLKGAIVYHKNQYFNAGMHNLEINQLNLPKGVYVLKISNNNKTESFKFYQL